MMNVVVFTSYLLYLSLVGSTSTIDTGVDNIFNNKLSHETAKPAPPDGEQTVEYKHLPYDTNRDFPALTAKVKSHGPAFPPWTLAMQELKRLRDDGYTLRKPSIGGYSQGTRHEIHGEAGGDLVKYVNDVKTNGKTVKTGVSVDDGSAVSSKGEAIDTLKDMPEGVDSTLESNTPHHRQKRGFRSAVADRIAHGFGKRTHPSVYNTFTSVADILARDYITDDGRSDRQIGIPIVELAKQFHDDQATLVDYISSYIDLNDDGVIDLKELLGDQ